MITSFTNLKKHVVLLGYDLNSFQCACNEIYDDPQDGTQFYITSTDDTTDIRYFVGIYTDVFSNSPAPAGYYAQEISEPVSGSQFHHLYWDGDSILEVFQANEGYRAGILKVSGSFSATTCNVAMQEVFFPSGETFYNATGMYLDPFGCANAPQGYYVNPIRNITVNGVQNQASKTRYWYSAGYFYANALTNWVGQLLGGPNTGYIELGYGSSAMLSVCFPTSTYAWQYCTTSTILWNMPLMQVVEVVFDGVGQEQWSYLPSGYYSINTSNNQGNGNSHYWNGTTGLWGATAFQDCSFTGMSDIRTKENIVRTGISKSGLPMYDFNYIGKKERWSGVMAQDLLKMGRADAVIKDKETGFYKVMYNRIDVDMKLIN